LPPQGDLEGLEKEAKCFRSSNLDFGKKVSKATPPPQPLVQQRGRISPSLFNLDLFFLTLHNPTIHPIVGFRVYSRMAFCRPQPPPLGSSCASSSRASPTTNSHSKASSLDASSPECFLLFPYTSTARSASWVSRKATPLWLQYLSQILSHPEQKSSSSSASLSCAVLSIRHSSHSHPRTTTANQPIPSSVGIKKKSSIYRKPSRLPHSITRK
jgi:hypothetical protein